MASSMIRFLRPIRAPLSTILSPYSYISHSTTSTPFSGSLQRLQTWLKKLEPVICTRASKFRSKLNIQGSGLRTGSIYGVSIVFGSVYFLPHVAYTMDGNDILVDDQLLGGSDIEEDQPALWLLVRKFWLPVFFLLSVIMNWNHPVTLAPKLVLFLLATKPGPPSVFIFVEKLCHQYMREEPQLYKYKPLYANKVEVQDYKLLCLARVKVKDEQINLVGILGGWWALPSSSWEETFTALRNRALKLYGENKVIFR